MKSIIDVSDAPPAPNALPRKSPCAAASVPRDVGVAALPQRGAPQGLTELLDERLRKRRHELLPELGPLRSRADEREAERQALGPRRHLVCCAALQRRALLYAARCSAALLCYMLRFALLRGAVLSVVIC